MSKAWGGRFAEATDKRVELFTESISFDARLAPYDVAGSIAHATMLAEVGIITEIECQQIVTALKEILADIEEGRFEFKVELEDIHMHIETALIKKIGDVGRKLHTARSRNDQVITDVKLYVRDAIDQIDRSIVELQRAFVSRYRMDEHVILPGYTHLQRAQPVMAVHYWLAYCEKLERDRSRLADCRKRGNQSPLGAAALAGTSLPINREITAKLLGFEGIAANSLDISSDRDFLLEFVAVCSLIAIHLSTWAEEWILWCTTEFSFLKLPDAFTTGSSIMPQKRNPDTLELTRGKTARVLGALQQLLVLTKSLPLAYNRDLQEDKLAVFDAADTIKACLDMAAPIVGSAKLNVEKINARLEDGFLDATALMEYLIKKGVPMRTGHEIVGKLVGLCESRNIRLKNLSLDELQSINPAFSEDVYSVLGVENAVNVLTSYGSGGKIQVTHQLEIWKQKYGMT